MLPLNAVIDSDVGLASSLAISAEARKGTAAPDGGGSIELVVSMRTPLYST
jgi:hypothetical protein